jgi:glycerophosphoryl diester phosphodiesterase
VAGPAGVGRCPVVVGHRANTVRWIRRHLAEGADGVEVDVYIDGNKLVVGHPRERRRYPLLRERIASLLAGIHISRGVDLSRLPRLVGPGRLIWLDLKSRDSARLLHSMPREVVEWPRLVVSTRYHDEVPLIRSVAPRALAFLSLQSRPPSLESLTRPARALGVTIESTYIDEGLVSEARSAGVLLAAWVVNEPEEAARLIKLGVDYIITDFPGVVREACRRIAGLG